MEPEPISLENTRYNSSNARQAERLEEGMKTFFKCFKMAGNTMIEASTSLLGEDKLSTAPLSVIVIQPWPEFTKQEIYSVVAREETKKPIRFLGSNVKELSLKIDSTIYKVIYRTESPGEIK
jgi:hypothetical protein